MLNKDKTHKRIKPITRERKRSIGFGSFISDSTYNDLLFKESDTRSPQNSND